MNPAEVEILLIEDNHDEALLTIRGLRKQHLANKLLHIDDGEEALDFLFGRGKYASPGGPARPRLVLLDLKLPKVDGLEILRQMKADPGTALLPVVILTSSGEEKDIVESYQLGVNSYIIKPVNFESFSKAVAELGMYWLLLNQSARQIPRS